MIHLLFLFLSVLCVQSQENLKCDSSNRTICEITKIDHSDIHESISIHNKKQNIILENINTFPSVAYGVQLNFDRYVLEKNCHLCYWTTYSSRTTSNDLDNCFDREFVFVGAVSESSSNVVAVGAFGESKVVQTTTGCDYSTNEFQLGFSNGVYCYNYPHRSFGFSPISHVSLYDADYYDFCDPKRLSWYLDHNWWSGGGWRAGTITGLTYDTYWMKGLWSCDSYLPTSISCSNGSVPLVSDCWCKIGYASSTGRASCYKCSNSSSANELGSPNCQCNINFYSKNGSDPCNKCSSGRESLPGSSYCVCSENTYLDVETLKTNADAPRLKCPNGSHTYEYKQNNTFSVYKTNPGAYELLDCIVDQGYYSLTGKIFTVKIRDDNNSKRKYLASGYPQQCPYGSYNSYIGNKDCYCLEGFYSNTGYALDSPKGCQICPQNKMNIGNGNTKCYCTKEFYKTDENKYSICDIGTSTSTIGGNVCNKCAIGYYSPTGNAPCAECPTNTSTISIGQRYCNDISSISYPTLYPTNQPVVSDKYSRQPVSECSAGSSNIPPKLNYTLTDLLIPLIANCWCVNGYFGKEDFAPCNKCPDGYTSDYASSYCFHCYGFSPCKMNLHNNKKGKSIMNNNKKNNNFKAEISASINIKN